MVSTIYFEVHQRQGGGADRHRRTRVQHLALLAAATLAMGIYPKPFTDVMQTSVSELLLHVKQSKLAP